MFNLGLCYDYGKGLQKDVAEAVKWYAKAAEKGYASAQSNLGFAFEKGLGVPKNEKEAMRWYVKAAEQKVAKTLNYLGKKLMTREIGQFDARPADFYFKELSGLELREKGSSENYLIGMGGLETGNFLKAKQALLMAGNQYGPTAQNIQPDSMRLTRLEDSWENYVLQILDKDRNPIGTGVFCNRNGIS